MDKPQSAAAQMYDDLMNGTFYEKQEKACPTTKYIYVPRKECIINGKEDVCPFEEISGKICSACKIPDRERTWDEIEKALEEVLD